ncbi:hypothetical protein [Actinoplanes friuliensis]|uniref:DUF1579 domain-containing protein n=1 Tax=Actinoplanes friuliensis DSM 7358 TaxID=1246995 RepID=U5VSF2_9ACTN|nr:hypothetical protein [Actinoplanes friuliensis]AGZ39794.1 hypothetical protein AFR_07525 [Actinoplanes friuliensis DSM 7358]
MTDLLEQLHADAPAPDVVPDLYGGLVGAWDVTNHYEDERSGVWRRGTVVWTFGRVLAGRAVQDVMWFTDDAGERSTGSTMRLFDPVSGAWRVVWFSPTGRTTALIGRPGESGDIVQEGERTGGQLVRWTFTAVTAESFRWLGHVSDDGGASWRLEQEMLARRREPAISGGGPGAAAG